MAKESLVDEITREIYEKTRDLSDSEYCDTLEEVIGNLQSAVECKYEEMADREG